MAGVVPKGGMVSFVDELVHHSTPDPSLKLNNECGVDDKRYFRLPRPHPNIFVKVAQLRQ